MFWLFLLGGLHVWGELVTVGTSGAGALCGKPAAVHVLGASSGCLGAGIPRPLVCRCVLARTVLSRGSFLLSGDTSSICGCTLIGLRSSTLRLVASRPGIG